MLVRTVVIAACQWSSTVGIKDTLEEGDSNDDYKAVTVDVAAYSHEVKVLDLSVCGTTGIRSRRSSW